MVASNVCGSIVIVTVPAFVMLSLGGFLGSSLMTPFRLCGFVQYFSNKPSLIQRLRDLDRDSARTPLSPMDWKSLLARSSCGSSTVGNGLPASTDRGKGGGRGSAGVGSWSSDRSRGVEFLRLASCSTRAAALAGSFLFLSMATRAKPNISCAPTDGLMTSVVKLE